MGQCNQGVGSVEIALKRAVVRFESPECQQDIPVNAIFAFDAIKYRFVLPCFGTTYVDPVLRDQTARKVDEWTLENPLRPVGAQHGVVLAYIGQKRIRRGRCNALCHGICFQLGLEGAERSSTLGDCDSRH